jgi:hypothetical protein
MHKHKESQEGRVELNIGGYRFETSVQTLRRVPHTFFDAYCSGRYAQDVCADGSIFVDRDGEHFGHVLEYMRNGVVSAAEAGANPSVSLLRALKREFGFYCIELFTEELKQPDASYIMGGNGDYSISALSSMERYDASLNHWSAVAAMNNDRYCFGACTILSCIYVTGGVGCDDSRLSCAEKYSPVSDTLCAVADMPEPRSEHVALAVGLDMYALGCRISNDVDDSIENGLATSSALKYDSMQDTWTRVAPMPDARYDAAGCAVGRYIFVFGGHNTAGTPQASVYKYDMEAEVWSILGPMPSASCGHTASLIGGLIYTVGASNNCSGALRFDPASGAWSTLARTQIPRHYGTSFELDGCLYVAGILLESQVERYDIPSNTWMPMADLIEGRRFFGAVTIGHVVPTEELNLFDSFIVNYN